MNPKHLSWKSPRDNYGDRIGHGTAHVGSKHFNSKLSEADAEYIKSMKDLCTQRELAERFSVSRGTISKIQSGLRPV